MRATRQLHDLDRSLWLYGIIPDLVSSTTAKHSTDELSVTLIRIGWQEESL
jgi:hypothetical protein